MKKTIVWMFFSGVLLLASCKGQFEKVRVSGNPELILTSAFAYYEKGEYQRAQTLFDLVLNNLRGDVRAEKAYFYYAYTHYHTKQYVMASYYFKNFSNTFVNSDFREEAAFLTAYSNFLQSPTFRLDQASTLSAIDEFQLFVNLFPNSARVEECNKLIDLLRRKLEEKAYSEGELYFDLKQYQSAVISFDNLLRDYPESPEAEKVRYLIAKADFLLSENSVVEKKIDRYQETITRCEEFLEKYPKSEYAREIRQTRESSEQAIKETTKILRKSKV